jgi:hypothetical protein
MNQVHLLCRQERERAWPLNQPDHLSSLKSWYALPRHAVEGLDPESRPGLGVPIGTRSHAHSGISGRSGFSRSPPPPNQNEPGLFPVQLRLKVSELFDLDVAQLEHILVSQYNADRFRAVVTQHYAVALGGKAGRECNRRGHCPKQDIRAHLGLQISDARTPDLNQ